MCVCVCLCVYVCVCVCVCVRFISIRRNTKRHLFYSRCGMVPRQQKLPSWLRRASYGIHLRWAYFLFWGHGPKPFITFIACYRRLEVWKGVWQFGTQTTKTDKEGKESEVYKNPTAFRRNKEIWDVVVDNSTKLTNVNMWWCGEGVQMKAQMVKMLVLLLEK